MLEMKNSIKKSFLCNYYCTGNKITSRRCMRNTCVMNQSYVSPTSKDNFIGYRREEDFIRNSGIIGFGFGVCCSLLQRRLLLPMDKVALFSRKNHEMPHHDSSVFSTRPFPRIQERARPSENFNESARESVVVVPFSYTYFGLTVVFGSKIENFEKIYAAAASAELFIAEFAY